MARGLLEALALLCAALGPLGSGALALGLGRRPYDYAYYHGGRRKNETNASNGSLDAATPRNVSNRSGATYVAWPAKGKRTTSWRKDSKGKKIEASEWKSKNKRLWKRKRYDYSRIKRLRPRNGEHISREVWAPGYINKTGAENNELRWRGFVINLKRRQKRMVAWNERTSRFPWFREKFCRLPGVDTSGYQTDHMPDLLYKHGHLDNETKISNYGFGGMLSSGAVGCYESHLKALKLIAEDDSIDFGVVAEDDLGYFSEDFEKEFNRIRFNSRPFWNNTDKIALQWCGNAWKNKNGITQPRKEVPFTSIAALGPLSAQKCTGLYAISRQAAKKLMAENGPLIPLRRQIDDVDIPWLRRRQFTPPIAQTLAYFDEGGSTDVQTGKNLPRRLRLRRHRTMPECEPVPGMEWLKPLEQSSKNRTAPTKEFPRGLPILDPRNTRRWRSTTWSPNDQGTT